MALGKQGKATICAAIALIAGDHALRTQFSPLSWAVCSLATWLVFVVCKGWGNLSRADKYQLIWAVASSGFWLHFITNLDPSFKVQACCSSSCTQQPLLCSPLPLTVPVSALVCLLCLAVTTPNTLCTPSYGQLQTSGLSRALLGEVGW